MKCPANGRYEEKVYESKKEKNAYHRRTQVNLAFPFKSRRVCAARISIRGGGRVKSYRFFTSRSISPQPVSVERQNFAHTYLNTTRRLCRILK